MRIRHGIVDLSSWYHPYNYGDYSRWTAWVLQGVKPLSR
jgi:hypothetical protein